MFASVSVEKINAWRAGRVVEGGREGWDGSEETGVGCKCRKDGADISLLLRGEIDDNEKYSS